MGARDLKRVREALAQADLVLVGASNGLDMAEGLNIFAPDAHFFQVYGDLAEANGARCILEGMFRSGADFAQVWAWYARFARCEWLDYEPGAVMKPLRVLVADTDHFVITCNTDARFKRAGFDDGVVLETEGSVAEMVCAARCCDERYPTDEVIRPLDASIVDGRVDATLVPSCPRCGAPLACAVDEARAQRPDATFVKWLETFRELCARHAGDNVVVLELGVGLRNGTIKRLLADAVMNELNLTYVVFNYNQVVFPHGLEHRCVGIDGDMAGAFRELM